MELRLDRLLGKLRDDAAAILEAIDGDPLLLKRQSGPLVLANASQSLYTPQQEHQLFAKGIVYRAIPRDCFKTTCTNPKRKRGPPSLTLRVSASGFETVSTVFCRSLIKIYNLGERYVAVADLTALMDAPHGRLHFFCGNSTAR